MESKYKVKLNDEIKGPYKRGEILALIQDGFFPAYIKCCEIGQKSWLALDEMFSADELESGNLEEGFKLDDVEIVEAPKEDSRKVFVQKMRQQNEEIAEPDDFKETILSRKTDEDYKEARSKGEKDLKYTLNELERGRLSKDKTQFYDLDEFKKALQEADETEKVLEEKKVFAEQTEFQKAIKDPMNKRLFMSVLVTLVALWFILDTGEKKVEEEAEFVFPKITNPIVTVENKDKSEALFDRVQENKKEGYLELLSKSNLLKEALRFYGTKEAREQLIDIYGKLLRFSQNPIIESVVISKQLRLLGRSNWFMSEQSFEAKLSLYFYQKKYNAVIYFYEKYLRLNKKDTQYSLSLYIRSLIKSGKTHKIKLSIAKAVDVSKKSEYIYGALLEYLKFENNFEDFLIVAREAHKVYPEDLDSLFHLAKMYAFKKKNKLAISLVKEAKEKKFYRHPIYKALAYEVMGSVEVNKKNSKKAFDYFQKSYSLVKNPDVISKMGAVRISGDSSQVEEELKKANALENLQRSKNFSENKNWTEALFSAIHAVDLYPSFMPAKLQLARVQINRGYFDDAQKVLKKVISPLYVDEKNKLELQALIKSKRVKVVADFLRTVNPTKLKTDFELNALVAEYYYELGEKLRSLFWFKKVIDINPLHDKTYWRMSQVYRELGDYVRAKVTINEALEIDPSITNYHIQFAKILFDENGLKTAAAYLRNLDPNEHDENRIKNQIAVFYYETGEIGTFKLLEEKLNLGSKTDKDLYYFLMDYAARSEDYASVVKYGSRYLTLNPSDHNVRIFLAQHYFYLQDYENAERQLEMVKKRVKAFPQVNSELSRLALIADEFDEAEALAKTEIKLNPHLYYGYLQAARVEIKRKKYILAEGYLNKALRIAPENIYVLTELGFVYLKRNRYDEALSHFSRALELDEDHYHLYYRIGETYQLKGNYQEAAQNYQTYLNLNPRAIEKDEIEKFITDVEKAQL